MNTLTEIFWRFGKRLWFRWEDRVTGKTRLQTNCATWGDLWRHRNDSMKVWVD